MIGAGQAAYLGLLGAVIAERLFELWIARRNAARAFAQGAVEVGQRHYRVMTALHTAFLASCAVELVALEREPSWVLAAPMVALVLAAQALRYWSIRTLGERWNTRIIVLPGAPPVVAGPYRWVRHPNYVAVVVELAALPLAGGCVWTAVVFSLANAALLAVRIRAEEAALGVTYQAAFAEKRRFLP